MITADAEQLAEFTAADDTEATAIAREAASSPLDGVVSWEHSHPVYLLQRQKDNSTWATVFVWAPRAS